MRKALGFDRLLLINDFTALALSLPALQPEHLRRIGTGGTADPKGAVGLIGPGTGLGVSGPAARHLRPRRCRWAARAATSAWRRATRARTRSSPRCATSSATRRPSARCRAWASSTCTRRCARSTASPRRRWIRPASPAPRRRAAIARCVEAVEIFFAFLGSVAGNLALTLGSRGGMYIGGGIVPRLGDWIDRSAFRERFVAKGRFRDYLDGIPTWLIHAETSPALIGAANALDQL